MGCGEGSLPDNIRLLFPVPELSAGCRQMGQRTVAPALRCPRERGNGVTDAGGETADRCGQSLRYISYIFEVHAFICWRSETGDSTSSIEPTCSRRMMKS